MDWCSSRVGICRTQWQWLSESFERPHYSEPKRIATGESNNFARMDLAPCAKTLTGCWSCRCRIAVLPTTTVQSATASATVLNSLAAASTGEAPTADFASRNATSYGFTTRNWVAPKLLIARATAPMFNGLRGATSTTRRSIKQEG